MPNIELHLVAWSVDESVVQPLEPFLGWLVHSPYWSNLEQYGVGAGSLGSVVELDGDPPATLADSDIAPWLARLIATNRLPPRNANSVYIVLLPQATTFAGDPGYHGWTADQQGGFAFEVMSPPRVGGAVDFDQFTSDLSHETAETATDPQHDANDITTGWYSDEMWFGEIGDLCQDLAVRSLGAGYKLSRLYSNAAARAGRNPCVPAVGTYQGVQTIPRDLHLELDRNGNATTTVELLPFSGDPAATAVTWWAGWVNDDPHVTLSPMEGSSRLGTGIKHTLTITAEGASSGQLLDLTFVATVPAAGQPDWNAGYVSEWNTELVITAK